MEKMYPDLNQMIADMTEGDEAFERELIQAIFQGLLELKAVYTEGYLEQDEIKIQQIRHKIKPTLMMFGLEPISLELQNGKEIVEAKGFNSEFKLHFSNLNKELDLAIQRVSELTD